MPLALASCAAALAMRPAAEPTDADLVALRALRAGLGLPADATDAVVFAEALFVGALFAAAPFDALIFEAFLAARAAVVLAVVALVVVAFAVVVLAADLRDVAVFAADFATDCAGALRCLAAVLRAGLAAA